VRRDTGRSRMFANVANPLTRLKHCGSVSRVEPLVSILLPAFDAASTLPSCLRSIARQTEPRWECVLVDDGSSDATLALARAAARRDPRFVVVPTRHRGLVAALNTGLARCRAPLVARMDADDLMHRDRLAAQVRVLASTPELVAVGCHVRLFPRAHLTPGLRHYERWLRCIDSARRVREDAFIECPVAHPTLVVRRDVASALGYRDLGWPEDYDLVLRLLERGHAIGVVPRRLLAWRDRPGRLWRTGERYRLERFAPCKAAFLATGFLADTDRYILWGYGATGRELRRALAAHGKRPSHVVDVHPGRLGNRIDGAPVIAPEALSDVARRPVIVSVAGEEPRRLVRRAMTRMGLHETRDFVVAA
jgi:glycosyltransferase involved in cell wall biosynthesis